MKKIINVTTKASEQLHKLLKHSNMKFILFSVKGGGCNGFNYSLEPTNNDKHKYDEIYFTENNDKIIICGNSLFHLLGTTIDYQRDFMGQYFRFINPNESSKCGCGKSFN